MLDMYIKLSFFGVGSQWFLYLLSNKALSIKQTQSWGEDSRTTDYLVKAHFSDVFVLSEHFKRGVKMKKGVIFLFEGHL